jgi:hypothetical protein
MVIRKRQLNENHKKNAFQDGEWVELNYDLKR